MMPAKQVALLSLWDKLAIPHNRKKQLFGVSLPIIGFNVILSTLRITMPHKSHLELIIAICLFMHVPPSAHQWHSLCDFQQLAK